MRNLLAVITTMLSLGQGYLFPGPLRAMGPACASGSRHLCRNSHFIHKAEAAASGQGAKRRAWWEKATSTEEAAAPAAEADTVVDIEDEKDPGEIDGYRIVKYPHPALRAENEKVTKFGSELKKLTRSMFKLMYAAQGVGLAAPQVGVNKRVMVFNPEGSFESFYSEVILVNPEIVDKSEATDFENEGCLSFPKIRGDVERSESIKVKAFNVKGKPIKREYHGWTARIFQHEYDHLDGTVMIDRFSEDGRKEVQPRLNALIEKYGEGGVP
uniref:Peptide deformylase n=1 Tax=Fibrocapsa japonica TaxID=94617 RepID=A0A7S2XZL6_9STRA|mmetsp:Transcript_280/g.458  ORF Transcript_280/g.458 Transcript_280/m.458 type:complete len:270 (+) Transcript_280:104-913(+)|eukprot:CAMPEP_0113937742 /NCGR_PEP_ID=MMETSP1339-20121228/4296_1 /TAXON_ID=94617 /ORGANISM="Fibrocapsa japonica" /LENGTH=269 /DNA_ID=CAMNT_0000940625 /DNA_START=94 /DNA_END=903 /DNA_ORIENTATION=+ /assembly_acc=CAM_ASM_000762